MPRPLVGGTLILALVAGLAAGQDKAAPKTSKGKSKDPVPGYELRTIEGFKVLINQKCLAEIESAKDNYDVPPLEVLENEFKALNQILMPKLLKVLQGITIWVEWDDYPPGTDEESKLRGVRVVAVYRYGSPYAGLRSFQKGDLSHPGKMNNVEIMSLKTLTSMHQPGKEKDQIVLLHELCHTVHHVFLGNENRDVLAAYKSAMDRDLYKKAYARTNAHEYFAEVSCAYLDRCNFAPHTADELKEYDPEAYKLCEKVWGKQDVIAKARAKAAAEREARAKLRQRAAASAAPKPATPTAPAEKADPEKVASQKLEFIRSLVKDGKKDKAKERLKELIQAYPGTQAAAEAEKMLESL
jgi:hypothetical protein